jgi:hypothetical protein
MINMAADANPPTVVTTVIQIFCSCPSRARSHGDSQGITDDPFPAHGALCFGPLQSAPALYGV